MENIVNEILKCFESGNFKCVEECKQRLGYFDMENLVAHCTKYEDTHILKLFLKYDFISEFTLIHGLIGNDRLDVLLDIIEMDNILPLATEYNNIKLIEKLFEIGADPNRKGTISNYTPLNIAVRLGNIEMMQLMFDHKAVIDDETLKIAVRYKHVDIIRMLLDMGANAKLALKQTYDPDIILMLLDTIPKDELDLKGIIGQTIFCTYAVDLSHKLILKFIQILLERGADPNEVYKSSTLLENIITYDSFVYDVGHHKFYIKLAKLLITYGVHVDQFMIYSTDTPELKLLLTQSLNTQNILIKSALKTR